MCIRDSSFTEELRANFGDFVSAGIDLILSLANGLVEGLPQLFAYIPDIVINIAGLINDNAPKILAGAVGLMAVSYTHLIPPFREKIFPATLTIFSSRISAATGPRATSWWPAAERLLSLIHI